MSAVVLLCLSCLVVIVDIALGPADVYNLIYLTTGETPRRASALWDFVQTEKRTVTVLLDWLPPGENIQNVSRVLPGAERKDEQCWEATLNTFRETRNGEWLSRKRD